MGIHPIGLFRNSPYRTSELVLQLQNLTFREIRRKMEKQNEPFYSSMTENMMRQHRTQALKEMRPKCPIFAAIFIEKNETPACQ